MRKYVICLLTMLCTVWTTMAGAAPQVDETIFKWVQSSSRCDYFFNVQQISYGKDDEDQFDYDMVIVPVLKVYDDLMIHDVFTKRRWNGNSVEGFDNLVGAAEYYVINTKDKTVYFREQDYLDSTWSTLAVNKPDQSIEMANLSEKSFDYKFYSRIIDYALRNRVKLALRSNGTISDELLAQMQLEQDEYRLQNKEYDLRDNEELSEADAARVKAAMEAQEKAKKDKKRAKEDDDD